MSSLKYVKWVGLNFVFSHASSEGRPEIFRPEEGHNVPCWVAQKYSFLGLIPQLQNQKTRLDHDSTTRQHDVALVHAQGGQLENQLEWVKADGERASLKVMIQFLVAALKAWEIRLSKPDQVHIGKEMRQFFIKVDPTKL